MALTTDDYLIKIGDNKIPNEYIDKDSYTATHDFVVAGTFQDANGSTYENYFPQKKLTVSFSSSNMTKSRWDTLRGYFTSNFISNTEDVMATCWVPKLGAYVLQRCKVSGLTPALHKLSHIHDGVYDPVRITLTGYARSE